MNTMILALLLASFAVLLYLADRHGRQTRDISQLRMRDTIFIGIAQAIALLPGTSRSGVTMSAALFRDLNRADSARYSFLLVFPLILAAGLLGLGGPFAALRRQLLAVAASLAAGSALSVRSGRSAYSASALAAAPELRPGRTVTARLVAAERP